MSRDNGMRCYPLNAIKSDYVRERENADWGMIRRVGYMLFWAAAITFYLGEML